MVIYLKVDKHDSSLVAPSIAEEVWSFGTYICVALLVVDNDQS